MMPENSLFTRDIIDSQLESADHLALGRVADIEMTWQVDGSLVLTALLTGPQALSRRVAHGLQAVCAFFLRGRCETRLPLQEVVAFGPTIHLRAPAAHYEVGRSERWLARHFLRWIPGSGYR